MNDIHRGIHTLRFYMAYPIIEVFFPAVLARILRTSSAYNRHRPVIGLSHLQELTQSD